CRDEAGEGLCLDGAYLQAGDGLAGAAFGQLVEPVGEGWLVDLVLGGGVPGGQGGQLHARGGGDGSAGGVGAVFVGGFIDGPAVRLVQGVGAVDGVLEVYCSHDGAFLSICYYTISRTCDAKEGRAPSSSQLLPFPAATPPRTTGTCPARLSPGRPCGPERTPDATRPHPSRHATRCTPASAHAAPGIAAHLRRRHTPQ